jgi:hypothetical protein
MNYLNFFCSECKHHGHNVFARGVCYHPEVDMEMDDHCIACHRLDLLDKYK